jgi:methionyl-tRNA formyltransferase
MSTPLRILFMGTPDFAVKSLETLHQNFTIIGVVTAPDKKRGRGQKVVPTPVKEYAVANNIPVLQPTNLKDEHFVQQLTQLKPDLNVIVAFRMLPEVVWALPRLGSLNLHASLLPEYRGAAPINHAIMNGETETGVTTFFLRHEIDTGNIILQDKVPITYADNAGTVHDRLMVVGAELLKKTIENIENETISTIPQPQKIEKTAPKIFKENCEIDWFQPGEVIYNFVRGLSPYPTAWTVFKKNEKAFTVKIFKGKFLSEHHSETIGKLLIKNGVPTITVKGGFFEIHDLQPQSKKRITGEEFVRGLQNGDTLAL